jgi:hypothetical protein
MRRPSPWRVAAARLSGHPVEVSALASETRQVMANPSGSLTLVQHAEPVRVRSGNGWVPVNTTLRIRRDGSVAPVATAADVVFSGGGAHAPLVSLRHESGRLALRWPNSLPVPTVSGDTATYPNVRPGVDLRVTAQVDGFSDVLVVRDRAAAAGLSRVLFDAETSGLRLQTTAGGGMAAVRATGQAVFSAPAPQMWDATAGESGNEAGGHRVRMQLQLDGARLAVLPDQRMLTDPTTRYPLYIDPSVSLGLVRWGNILGYPTSLQGQSIASDPLRKDGAKAGYTYDEVQRKNFLYRSVFDFDIMPLIGRHVQRAVFSATLLHSWSCSDTPVQLWNIGGHISDSFAWNTMPWTVYLLTRSGHANSKTCGQPPQRMEFGGNADAPSSEDNSLANNLQVYARDGWSGYTLGLQAPNEQDVNQFKRFGDAALAVDSNSYPWPPLRDPSRHDGPHPNQAAEPSVPPCRSCVKSTSTTAVTSGIRLSMDW